MPLYDLEPTLFMQTRSSFSDIGEDEENWRNALKLPSCAPELTINLNTSKCLLDQCSASLIAAETSQLDNCATIFGIVGILFLVLHYHRLRNSLSNEICFLEFKRFGTVPVNEVGPSLVERKVINMRVHFYGLKSDHQSSIRRLRQF